MRPISQTADHAAGRALAEVLPELAALWALSTGDPELCIAVLDGPVDRAHPSLAGARLAIVSTGLSGVTLGGPASMHGTEVASLIFGQPASPVRGIAPRCRGLLVPVFADGPAGTLQPCSQLDLARAIGLAIENGAHIINISGGQLDTSGVAHPLLASAIAACAARGILVVAAAGNDGCECMHLPAAMPEVVAVGALGADGEPAPRSNVSRAYLDHGILAPGEDLRVAAAGGGVRARSGTSFATAVVTGAAALIASIARTRRADLSMAHVGRALIASAAGCDVRPVADCRRLLRGRLDIRGALRHLTRQGDIDVFNDKESGNAMTPDALGGAASTSAAVAPAGSDASACACGGSKPAATQGPSRIYVLGNLGFDFASQTRRDSFVQSGLANPDDPHQLLAFLQANPAHAIAVTWTLAQETMPIYAIQPSGPFAEASYRRVLELLAAQTAGQIERVSIPGTIVGSTTLRGGQAVPVIWPEIRGMYGWSTGALVEGLLGAPPAEGDASALSYGHKKADIGNFLQRVYYELRNLGVTAQERAINYAATNAFQIEHVYGKALKGDLKLDTIEVERSPLSRPGTDCWDVKLIFFHPAKRLEQARDVYRFTVDVSDIVPVTVGPVRNWHVY